MKRIYSFLIVTLCLGLGGTAVFAHGGGKIQLANQEVGDCKSTVWLNPPKPRANEVLHITVGISDTDQAPVLSSDVEVSIVQNEQIVATDFAKTENSVNRLFYEVDFDPQSTGTYEVQLVYEDEGCTGKLSFPMQVSPASYVRVYALGVFVLVGGFFVLRTIQRRGSASATPQRRYK